MTAGDDGSWQAPYEERAAELAARLRQVVEALDEVVVDHLRTAVDHGVQTRPPLDKRFQAARRAVEKAARTLEGA